MPKIVSNLIRWWALLGGVLILLIVLVTTTNVGAFTLDRLVRPFGGTVSGLPGYEDFVRLAISCAALMFFPWCQLKRGHVAVDLFVAGLPAKLRRALDALWMLLAVALALFLAYWMVLGMLETYTDNALSRVLGWAEWPFYIPGIVSLLLWALVCAMQLRYGDEAEAHTGDATHG
jgi:TRAP-type C4-dicarboxylate transport system permease small subunit